MSIKRIVLCAALAVSVCAFIPTRPDTLVVAPAPFIDGTLTMPPAVRALVQRSCTDCHSSGTRWPWYGKIPPAKWIIEHDIARARHSMDLTDWSRANGRAPAIAIATLAAACGDLKSGRMPRADYLWMHPDARPRPEEVEQFCAWTQEETIRLIRAARQPR